MPNKYMKYNIIIVGAKDVKDHEVVENWNNKLQASHEDLLNISNDFVKITCYDPQYAYTISKDDIEYTNELFGLQMMSKEHFNIIIEFCNMFDENFVNRQYYQYRLSDYNDYKLAILSCGCGWNKWFPIECVLNIIYSDNIFTPTDPYNVDNFLYVISTVQYIYVNKMQECNQPYLLGLYQTMGTLKWRGSESDAYASERVLRELFSLIGTDAYDLSDRYREELQAFVRCEKHWNKLPWSLRELMCKYIYGCEYK